jgi:GT2 family glycosyltransferase
MKIAVIIPTVGRTFFVLSMIMMLRAGQRVPDQIVIVEQTDTDKRNPFAFDAIKHFEAQGLCQVINSSIKSATVARNIGIANADADILIFVDDDAIITPSFVLEYERLFQDEELDAATGLILVSEDDGGTIDTSRVHVSAHNGHTMLRGGNFAVRREAILAVGGLDENFVGAANHEDADLAFRLHQQGLKVVWSPKPWLYHLAYSGGGGRIANPMSNINFTSNLVYFHLRHQELTGAALLRLLRWRVFNKETIKHPWRVFGKLLDFIEGYRRASRLCQRPPNLPFKTKN